MSNSIDPMLTPLTWREFLYNSILLASETKKVQVRTGAFDKKVLDSKLGLHVVRKTRLADMEATEKQYAKHPGEFLVFFSNEPGWAPLLKRLRDTAAHGHFGLGKRGWLTIRHSFKGPRDKVMATRIFGNLKFQSVKHLTEFINLTHKV
jgi:hypothetical protein